MDIVYCNNYRAIADTQYFFVFALALFFTILFE